MKPLVDLGDFIELWDAFSLTRPHLRSSEEVLNSAFGDTFYRPSLIYIPLKLVRNQEFFDWLEVRCATILTEDSIDNCVFRLTNDIGSDMII